MDLLSTIRKSGSRGGVNFSWDEVANSTHRENYLGHSLKAPVGRWQQGKDLNWYAKSEATAANADETNEERQERERKEELRKVKEAEEDAMARALGLPIKQRNSTGANAIEVKNTRKIGPTLIDATEKAHGEDKTEQRTNRHKQGSRSSRGQYGRKSRSRSRERHRGRGYESRTRRHSHDRGVAEQREHGRERRRRDEVRNHRDRSPRRDRSRERYRSRSRERRHGNRRPLSSRNSGETKLDREDKMR